MEGAALAAAVAEADVVLDGTDNFRARYAINEACVMAKTPLVSGAAIRLEGQVTVIDPRCADAPCYRCLYGDAGDEALNCAENGVAAPLVGIIGSVQAMEASEGRDGRRREPGGVRVAPRCQTHGVAQVHPHEGSDLPHLRGMTRGPSDSQ